MSEAIHSLRVLSKGFAYDTVEREYRLQQLDDLIATGLAYVRDQYLAQWARRTWTVREVALSDKGREAAAALPPLRRPYRRAA